MDKSCGCKQIKVEDTVKHEVDGVKEEYIVSEATSSPLRLLGCSFCSIIIFL